jgi:hypothetical protein
VSVLLDLLQHLSALFLLSIRTNYFLSEAQVLNRCHLEHNHMGLLRPGQAFWPGFFIKPLSLM